METNDTDKLLKDFFSGQKQQIPDNGFTQMLMRKLPDEQDHSWIVWVFACIGMTLTLALGIQVGWLESLFVYLHQIQILYFLGAIFCFPLIFSFGIYLAQTNHYRVI